MIILALSLETTKIGSYIFLGLIGLFIASAIAILVIGVVKKHKDDNDELPDFFTETEEVEDEIEEEDLSSVFSIDEDLVFESENEASELMKGVQLASRNTTTEQVVENKKFGFFKKS